MIITILIAFLSLMVLIILHEFGHFVLAKRFGVRVEEFGVGLPPRVYGKKVGETIYSINALPLGGFVRLYGEEETIKESRSFTGKPVWQRALIILAGVVAFWIISIIILSLIAGIWGLPTAVTDEENSNLKNPKITVSAILPNSPAKEAGLMIGDVIQELKIDNLSLETDKVKDIVRFVDSYKGEKITLTVQRGSKYLEASLVPRVSPPEGEGPLGVGLTRVALKPYPWYQAPLQGLTLTADTTVLIPTSIADALWQKIQGKPAEGVEFRGIVGIVDLLSQAAQVGINNFLYLIAVISIFVAFFNILPIPALDGGKLLFLGIEAITKKPVPQRIEQSLTSLFFFILIALIIFITIQDITRLI